MPYTALHKIRFDDVDGAGIVYYPHFFHLCHATFEDFFDDEAPFSYPELIVEKRHGFPTVNIKSDFSSPLKYGDSVIVQMGVDKLGQSSVTLDFSVLRQNDDHCCFQAQITTVFMDLDTQKAVELPDELRSIFARIAKD